MEEELGGNNENNQRGGRPSRLIADHQQQSRADFDQDRGIDGDVGHRNAISRHVFERSLHPHDLVDAANQEH